MDRKEKEKEYYQRNRERILERNKKYIADHYDRYTEYQAQYWLKKKAQRPTPDPEVILEIPKPVFSIRFPEGGINPFA